MSMRWALWGAVLVAALSPASGHAADSFVTFETGQVRPLALSPDGSRLFAVNTPDDRLEVFDVDAAGLHHATSVPVGLEPLAVAARTNSEVWVVNHLSDSVSVVMLDPFDSASARVAHTIPVCDEPRDIVFAGPGGSRAFITTARRGQSCPVPALLTTPGVGRALVMVFDATLPEAAPLTVLELFSDTPRALAADPSGSTVYAAGFHSGNQTTIVSRSLVCPGGAEAEPCVSGDAVLPGGLPAPNTNVEGVPQPEAGLIVKLNPATGLWEDEIGRDWSDAVRFNLPDEDVFAIDAMASPPVPTAAFAGVGTVLFNMAVNPATGVVYVSNTEARNEVRFEGPGILGTTVRGHLHEARITVLSGAAVSPRHLNKHIDYDAVPTPAGVKERSLATPVGLAVSSDGADLYVAAFGSSKIGVFDTAELESDTFVPDAADHVTLSGGGPSGLVLDEARGRLYALTRFDNAISIVDLGSRTEVGHLPLYNPEPPSVVAGRPFLYDATFTSSNGEASCGGCHVFGDFDSLAWDLGNPDAPVVDNLNVGGGAKFHPMKGPLMTQSLRGLLKQGPMHWRGDRTGAADPTSGDLLDEAAAFRAFNVAFGGLLGRDDGPIPAADMQAFADFALEIRYPPNPIRNLDNSLTPSQARGRDVAVGTGGELGGTKCHDCHVIEPEAGFFGAAGIPPTVPHFRNLYQKVGMFGMPQNVLVLPGDNAHTGDQIRGFGFNSEGSADTVFRFLRFVTFLFPGGDAQRRDTEQFLLAMDTNLAPIVGQQATLTSTNAATAGPRIDLMVARADAPLPTDENPDATECDLVVKGAVGLEARGWVRMADGTFRSDRAGEAPLTDAELRAQAAAVGGELTYTCVPWGSGVRIGIDRDEDGFFDRDERDAGTDPTGPDRISGGGSRYRDCVAEWTVYNPSNDPFLDSRGRLRRRQVCRDGDALCDADGTVNGRCVFEVGVCFNVADPNLPLCPVSDVLSWELRRPRPDSTRPLEASNARTLRDAVLSLGTGTVSGLHQERVTFAPPLGATSLCTERVPIAVDGKGRLRLRTQSRTTGGGRDRDRIQLRCLPG